MRERGKQFSPVCFLLFSPVVPRFALSPLVAITFSFALTWFRVCLLNGHLPSLLFSVSLCFSPFHSPAMWQVKICHWHITEAKITHIKAPNRGRKQGVTRKTEPTTLAYLGWDDISETIIFKGAIKAAKGKEDKWMSKVEVKVKWIKTAHSSGKLSSYMPVIKMPDVMNRPLLLLLSFLTSFRLVSFIWPNASQQC